MLLDDRETVSQVAFRIVDHRNHLVMDQNVMDQMLDRNCLVERAVSIQTGHLNYLVHCIAVYHRSSVAEENQHRLHFVAVLVRASMNPMERVMLCIAACWSRVVVRLEIELVVRYRRDYFVQRFETLSLAHQMNLVHFEQSPQVRFLDYRKLEHLDRFSKQHLNPPDWMANLVKALVARFFYLYLVAMGGDGGEGNGTEKQKKQDSYLRSTN